MINVTDSFTNNSVIAIGDIHGRLDLFRAMMEKLRDTNATVICLGDLIDRGPDDVGVLELAKALLNDPNSWGLNSFYVLRGNHEDMFLKALEYEDYDLWIDNGGAYDKLRELHKHAGWMSALPYYMTVGKTIFAHAGTPPGEDPATYMQSAYKREDFVWQRRTVKKGAKLRSWTKTYKQVVFGHTPEFGEWDEMTGMPYEVPGGICIDSGAVYTGVLTAYNVTNNTYVQVESKLC